MIVLGRIVAPYGVHGWVKVHPFGDGPEDWQRMERWWLSSDAEGEDWQAYGLKALKVHGKGLVASFTGVDDRVAAEGLEGYYIAAPREDLPKTAPGEYYWGDLVGLQVENEQGECLGAVAELIESGANTVLVVREGEAAAMRERLLPFVAHVVKDVDVAAHRIRVDWGSDW
jgi:16S rRNA processing protein RimM